MRFTLLVLAVGMAGHLAVGWHAALPLRVPSRARAVRCALDFDDPDVAAEFSDVSSMSTDELEDELMMAGIPPPPTVRRRASNLRRTARRCTSKRLTVCAVCRR